jgi:hypothetical protein
MLRELHQKIILRYDITCWKSTNLLRKPVPRSLNARHRVHYRRIVHEKAFLGIYRPSLRDQIIRVLRGSSTTLDYESGLSNAPNFRVLLHTMTLLDAFTTVLISTTLLLTTLFLHRLLKFFIRLRNFRKTMPAIPCLFPPDSPFRLLLPRKYQTFHKDWHLHYQRSIYRQLGSDIFALVCLFEYDKVFVCEPEAVLEIKLYKPREFPRDMQVFKKVNALP